MNAEYYSDNSIAIFGDTKPWKENLKMLGASYNPHLKGPEGIRVGWIIPITKEDKIMQFIDDADKGRVLPLPVQPKTPKLSQVYHLKTPKTPKTPTPKRSTSKLSISKPSTPKTMLPMQPTTVLYPNLFTGADNLEYQIIIYTVVCPTVGQKVTITIGENILEYQVTEIEKASAPFDSIKLAPQDDLTQEARAVIINGVWKIENMTDDHSLVFLE